MSDLISRQDAINELYNINPSEDMLFVDAIIDMLENLPEKSEQKWISVTEALPEEGRYLVTRYDYVTKSSFIDILWFEKNTWWNRQITGNFSVLAWMPLPKPWENNNG